MPVPVPHAHEGAIWIQGVASEIVDPNVRITSLLGVRVGGCLSN